MSQYYLIFINLVPTVTIMVHIIIIIIIIILIIIQSYISLTRATTIKKASLKTEIHALRLVPLLSLPVHSLSLPFLFPVPLEVWIYVDARTSRFLHRRRRLRQFRQWFDDQVDHKWHDSHPHRHSRSSSSRRRRIKTYQNTAEAEDGGIAFALLLLLSLTSG